MCGASTPCPAAWSSGPAATIAPIPIVADDGRNDEAREGRKVVRGAGAINLPATRRDTYRLSYPWWQGVWDVSFRVVCEDEDPV